MTSLTTIDAPIADVTVFRDRARVTRRAAVALAAGAHTLALRDLPTTLDESSVRATGRGAGVTLLGVDVTTAFVAEPPEAQLVELRHALEALEERDKALADAAAETESHLAFLDRLRQESSTTLARGIAFDRVSWEAVEGLSEYLARESDAARARRRALTAERRSLAREIKAAKRALERLQSGGGDGAARRAIHVSVEAEEDTELALDITYMATGATWAPRYDLRLTEGGVALAYLAQIQQRTGEDWPEVSLTLSTARQGAHAAIPELRPWYIAERPPPVPTPRAAPREHMYGKGATLAATVADDDGLGLRAEDMPAAAVASASVESRGAAVTYRVARPVAVSCDNSPHKTLVATLALEADLDYATVPKMSDDVYLRARVLNATEYTLAPGPVAIFHDDAYVGATRLETVAPSEAFDAQLGVDDRVKVKRELVKRTVDKKLIGGNRRTHFAYRVTLANHLARAARVTLYDQMPVPRHEDIKVRLDDASPDPTEETGLNLLRWEIEIAPEAEREVTFGFTVEYPREMDVMGLA